MSSTAQHYTTLFNRLLEGELSPQETDDIISWLGKEELDGDAKELIVAQLKQFVDPEKISPQVILALEAKLPAIFSYSSENGVVASSDQQPTSVEIASNDRIDDIRPVHRIHFLKTAWFRYAAAIVICLGIGGYIWTTSRSADNLVATNDNKSLQTDIGPGSEKAILTLSDGSKIVLDNAANGQLAIQQGSKVIKKDGQIVYDAGNILAADAVYNTMSTPRGGQYKLTLPDGTKVWLNAATSITYPIAFGKERKVKINGEAYFEVTQNKEKPFIVDIDGRSSVEVLGTSFNVNSYADESSIKTTLVEGSVKVVNGNQSAILKPGQQANQSVQTLGSIQIINNANIDQALAWKNGLFSFNDADLRSVMRQLERWYDINVRYEGTVSDLTLKGEMYRNVNLSDVLEFLQTMGIKTRMEGKKLIVL